MLPHSPDRVPKDLMRRVAVAVTESTGDCTLLFDDHGLRAFLDAWHSANCTTALRTLGATVTDPENYDRIDSDSLTITSQPDGSVLVDAPSDRKEDSNRCHDSKSRKDHNLQWRVEEATHHSSRAREYWRTRGAGHIKRSHPGSFAKSVHRLPCTPDRIVRNFNI